MLKIIQVETDEHKLHVSDLFREYLTWANSMVSREFEVSFDIRAALEQDLAKLHQFTPPTGRLLLGQYDAKPVGCACLKKIGAEIGEIKRMYVRSDYRRRGIGRSLLEALIEEARQIGYSKIRLDSAPFAKESQALYRKVGFQKIEPYAESEIPEEYRPHWVFMEMVLR
jgi:ribosomal protein S18 acetylase RimI-like enzyme